MSIEKIKAFPEVTTVILNDDNTVESVTQEYYDIDKVTRIEPPGWIMALMPALAAASMPSLNGKKASDAITEFFTTRFSSAALIPAIFYRRLVGARQRFGYYH
jgi:hypothetical protein